MAAAVATLRESTPDAIGMRTRTSAAARASGLGPGPSAPTSRVGRVGHLLDQHPGRLARSHL